MLYVKINSNEPVTTGQVSLSAVVIQYRILTVTSRNIWNLNITARRVLSQTNSYWERIGSIYSGLEWLRCEGNPHLGPTNCEGMELFVYMKFFLTLRESGGGGRHRGENN